MSNHSEARDDEVGATNSVKRLLEWGLAKKTSSRCELGGWASEAGCLDQFGVAPRKADCRGSFIKLTWFRALKDRLVLVDDIQIQRWHNWERENWPYRFRTLIHFRRDLDVLQEGQFVWEPYAIGQTDPDVILPNICQHSAIWSATVPFISFECIEWHASDRLRRQFGLTQGIPHQERDLGEMNRYSHVLVEHMVPSQHQADIYLHWYRGTYGDHLHLSDLEPQENQHGDPIHNEENQQVQPPPPPQSPLPTLQTQAQQELEQFTPYIPDTRSADYFTPPIHQQYWSVPHKESGEQGSFTQLLGFMAHVPGYSYLAYGDIPTDQRAQPSGIAPGRLSLDMRPRQLTSSGTSGGRLSVDSSRSDDATRGIIQSRNSCRVPMGLILESYQAVDEDNDDFLVDHPEGDENADEDEDEDDDEDEEDGEDDDDGGDGPDDGSTPTAGTTTSEKGKGYNFRADPLVGALVDIPHPLLTGLQRNAKNYTKM
ncbi:hypothetical protein Ahy_A10g049926 [Arachis hypogaea]|uniref:Aminotransferase-like plant mobile domain-containing protein n=1 Tax=Arachis hypogaea TaxID=3818 RepID=A0A445B870_ARAHY|nr:hypothetical protein Ahy_A10g049926 [Arachis hypogaea]